MQPATRSSRAQISRSREDRAEASNCWRDQRKLSAHALWQLAFRIFKGELRMRRDTTGWDDTREQKIKLVRSVRRVCSCSFAGCGKEVTQGQRETSGESIVSSTSVKIIKYKRHWALRAAACDHLHQLLTCLRRCSLVFCVHAFMLTFWSLQV